ncbi:hypothetical protein [Bradyrhizobium zhanjiangense]|nr:hypothetical protein [Bradyrhizobium zhanjiangense]
MQREFIFYLCCGVLVFRVDEEDITIDFVEARACEQAVEPSRADD